MKIFDLFSGCGGFRLAAELNGFESAGYSEINKYAIKFYNNIFEGETNHGDATKISGNELPEFEILCAGFPCQSFSIAGKRQGFNDTRGTMFFEVARILKDKRPRYFILKTKDPDILYSKTLKGCLVMTTEKLSKPYLKALPTLGFMLSNGLFLILDTSAFHKTERECLLSDILEVTVSEKYFLSKEKTEKILARTRKRI